jgi:hypothetical protein
MGIDNDCVYATMYLSIKRSTARLRGCTPSLVDSGCDKAFRGQVQTSATAVLIQLHRLDDERKGMPPSDYGPGRFLFLRTKH